ncbi:MAG: hypothetical protein JO010_04250 [Alphaproteobacteria bacterium]|nr:hypothetical protein [Alphaproteobacteria bacterium]
MPEFFESRTLRYEIHKLFNKRWEIAEIVGDGRETCARGFGRSNFEAVEQSVLGKANALLSGGEVAAVRVLRERVRHDGFSTTSEIFFREASSGKAEPPATVSRHDGPVLPCTLAEEVYARPACKTIGVLLRSYLDRQFITALELLHFHPYIRKLDDVGALVQGALHQVASAQVRTSGGDLKTRQGELQKLLAAVETKARDAMAEKRLPAIEAGGLEQFAERMRARYEGPQRRFFMTVALARHFQGAQSFMAKLDFALDALAGEAPSELAPILDELAAGCLDSSQLVMDLLGHQPSLAAALVALATLARGEEDSGKGAAASLSLRRLIAAGKLPHVADALWDRIAREFARRRPLSRTDDKREWNLLLATTDALLAGCPGAHKPAIAEAAKQRTRRIRDAALCD